MAFSFKLLPLTSLTLSLLSFTTNILLLARLFAGLYYIALYIGLVTAIALGH